MKKAIVILLSVGCTALATDTDRVGKQVEDVLYKAFCQSVDANQKADRDYRVAVSALYQLADRVEVTLLDFSMGEDAAYKPKADDAVFPILPYSTRNKVLASRDVPTKDIPAWRTAVTKMVTTNKKGGSALCHYPIHGLRIYAGKTLLFESSFCWRCNNYYFTYDGQGVWESLTEDANDLEKLLLDFMPIPKAELTRFDTPKQKPK